MIPYLYTTILKYSLIKHQCIFGKSLYAIDGIVHARNKYSNSYRYYNWRDTNRTIIGDTGYGSYVYFPLPRRYAYSNGTSRHY